MHKEILLIYLFIYCLYDTVPPTWRKLGGLFLVGTEGERGNRAGFASLRLVVMRHFKGFTNLHTRPRRRVNTLKQKGAYFPVACCTSMALKLCAGKMTRFTHVFLVPFLTLCM